jgi:nucleolar complex protein 3
VKRITSLALTSPSNSAIAYIGSVRAAIKRFPALLRFVEEDGRASTGTFNPFLNDPDVCNPFSTSLWEFSLLKSHYHPSVCAMTKTISSSKTNNNQGPLEGRPQELLIRFAPFQEDGFKLNPTIKIPTVITNIIKKFRGSKRGIIDGPNSWGNSMFLNSLNSSEPLMEE